MVNGNYGHEHQSIVSSLCFHPSENILMTSGLDRKVKLFSISHSQNNLSMATNNKNSKENINYKISNKI